MTPHMQSRDTQRLAQSNVEFLRQGRTLIQSLPAAVFGGQAPGGPRGGIGAHLRHVVDHYRCFLRGLGAGHIDYDQRDRDAGVEHDPARAVEVIDALCDELEQLTSADAGRELVVLVDCAEPEARIASQSSVARELQFLVSHTVHHYAVIALMARSAGFDPGHDFGVAPSTLKYERGDAACAR